MDDEKRELIRFSPREYLTSELQVPCFLGAVKTGTNTALDSDNFHKLLRTNVSTFCMPLWIKVS